MNEDDFPILDEPLLTDDGLLNPVCLSQMNESALESQLAKEMAKMEELQREYRGGSDQMTRYLRQRALVLQLKRELGQVKK